MQDLDTEGKVRESTAGVSQYTEVSNGGTCYKKDLHSATISDGADMNEQIDLNKVQLL